MAQVTQSVENNFTKGLVTEFTGLNFPENAATDADNVDFDLIGNVTRRPGIDYEVSYNTFGGVNRANSCISTFKWSNAGGTGEVDLFVLQVGATLYFYKSSAVTSAFCLSDNKLSGTVSLTDFVVAGSGNQAKDKECQYATGNGYLFVFHPYCEPFYCSFTPNTNLITTEVQILKTRDLSGVYEFGFPVESRPFTLGPEHFYNLLNQGWVDTPNFDIHVASANTVGPSGSRSWPVGTGYTIANGDLVNVYALVPGGTSLRSQSEYVLVMSGAVIGYSLGIITIDTYGGHDLLTGQSYSNWKIKHLNFTRATVWHGLNASVWPSNSDVLWYFKDDTGVFDPTQIANLPVSTTQAPKGHFIFEEFNQDRELVGVVDGLLNTSTNVRPKTGAWFAGRVWYSGVDASQSALASNPFYSWTENVYFSQVITDSTQICKCYQANDPTAENLFDLLPTDGGVIKIQGSGSVQKLFPIQNGLLVFATKGIWFITGSSGIGFTATDYVVTKISDVPCVSGTSFVNVQGTPFFWNEEGIYIVEQGQGGFNVQSITRETLDTFYSEIPVECKLYARGDYDPINKIIRWVYRDTHPANVTERYEFNRMLNYNIANKAFYTYTITSATPKVHGVDFVLTSNAENVDSKFKYITSAEAGGQHNFTFAEDYPGLTVDWASFLGVGVGTDFESYLVTGYRLKGQSMRKWKPLYVHVFSNVSDGEESRFYVQGIWDYANTGGTGRYSTNQLVTIDEDDFDVVRRRLKVRGSGITFQLKITSLEDYPFNIIGWSIPEIINTGV